MKGDHGLSSDTTATRPVQEQACITGEDPKVIGPLMRKILSDLEGAGIRWAIMRGAEGLPDYTRRDVDILVHHRDRVRAKQVVIAAAESCGWIWLAEFKRQDLWAEWLMLPGESPSFLPVELFLTQAWRGIPVVDGSVGLENRRRLNEWVWAVRTGFASAASVLKEILPHGTLKENARDMVAAGAIEDSEGFLSAIASTIHEEHLAQKLLSLCQQRKWDDLALLAPRLRKSIARPGPRNLLLRSRYFAYAALYRIRPPLSLFAVVLGPDGSGKTTVVDALAQRMFQHPFATIRRCKNDFGNLPRLRTFKNWINRLIGRKAEPMNDHEAGTRHVGMQPPNSALRSMIYVTYYGFGLFLGHIQLRLWRAIVGLVLFDRYYYDYYYMRAHSQVPRWYLDTIGLLVPRPDLIFYLHRDAEEIYAQKPELTVEEIRRQQEAIKRLLEGRKNARHIDASHGIEQTVCRVRDEIYRFLQQRANS